MPFRSRIVATATCCTIGLAGCGSSGGGQTPHADVRKARPSVARTTNRVASPTAASSASSQAARSDGHVQVIGGAVLLRHELPPAGVRQQVEYAGGAGPLPCDTPHRTHPRLTIFAMARAPSSNTKPEIGKELVVCTDGFAAGSPVTVKAVEPDNRTLDAVAPGGSSVDFYRGATIQLLPGLPLGRYVVTATQNGQRVVASFILSAATAPGLRVIRQPQHPGGSALLIGVGLSSNTRVNIYRREAGGPPNYGRYSHYVSSFPASPARDGTTTMRISTTTDTPTGCWWLVVTVHGSSGYDELCV